MVETTAVRGPSLARLIIFRTANVRWTVNQVSARGTRRVPLDPGIFLIFSSRSLLKDILFNLDLLANPDFSFFRKFWNIMGPAMALRLLNFNTFELLCMIRLTTNPVYFYQCHRVNPCQLDQLRAVLYHFSRGLLQVITLLGNTSALQSITLHWEYSCSTSYSKRAVNHQPSFRTEDS